MAKRKLITLNNFITAEATQGRTTKNVCFDSAVYKRIDTIIEEAWEDFHYGRLRSSSDTKRHASTMFMHGLLLGMTLERQEREDNTKITKEGFREAMEKIPKMPSYPPKRTVGTCHLCGRPSYNDGNTVYYWGGFYHIECAIKEARKRGLIIEK